MKVFFILVLEDIKPDFAVIFDFLMYIICIYYFKLKVKSNIISLNSNN